MTNLFLNTTIQKSINKRINANYTKGLSFSQFLEKLFNSELSYIRQYQSTDSEGWLYNTGNDYEFKNGFILKTQIDENGKETLI